MERKEMQELFRATAEVHTPEGIAAYRAFAAALTTPILQKIELESIEAKIIIAEGEVNRIESIFSSPEFFEKHAEQTNELNIQLAEAKEKVKLLYNRWEELEEISKSVNAKY